jgi:hypothetical protein
MKTILGGLADDFAWDRLLGTYRRPEGNLY